MQNFCESSFPPLIDNENIISDSTGKANLFAKLFTANSTLPPTTQTPPTVQLKPSSLGRVYFRTRAVAKVLLNLNIKKSTGPDGIPAIVLRHVAFAISKPLRNLFHLSFSSGVYPTKWKVAHVIPIPKKGDKSDPSNYRPVAIISILSKVMEIIINKKLSKYIDSEGIVHDRQYGFRSHRSTGDLMTYLNEKLNISLHNSGEANIIALDISKAFDRVWHSALLAKCQAIGLGSYFLKWIESFLSNRSIRVLVDGFSSDQFQLNAGVPQGSVLSPTLFLIFINDLLQITFNPIHSFADDSTLVATYDFHKKSDATPIAIATKRNIIASSINHDLSAIANWGLKNRVEFNTSKTQSCVVSRKTSPFDPQISFQEDEVQRLENLSILGMRLNRKMIWNDHIFDVAKNAAKCLGFLSRCKSYFSSCDLLKIYKAFIRPKMEYNSHIWAGASSSALLHLDRVQNRAIRLINDPNITAHLAPLKHRRIVGALSLFYRYLVGTSTCSVEIKNLLPPLKRFSRTTRGAACAHPYTVEIPRWQKTSYGNSFIVRTSRIWNLIPSNVFPKHEQFFVYDLKKFKTNINTFVRNSPPSFFATNFLSLASQTYQTV